MFHFVPITAAKILRLAFVAKVFENNTKIDLNYPLIFNTSKKRRAAIGSSEYLYHQLLYTFSLPSL